MFYHHLRNELWKLFGKKRTYIGFGAFLLAQNAMLLAFRFTHWQRNMEQVLAGNGYLARDYVSTLTVAVVMLILGAYSTAIRFSRPMNSAGSSRRSRRTAAAHICGR